MRGELKSRLDAPVDCQTYSDYSKNKKACDFAGFCQYLDRNRDRAVLYQSPSGGVISNYSHFRIVESALRECYFLKAGSDPAAAGKAENEEYEKRMTEHAEAVSKANKAFKDSIKKNGEEKAWFAINEAMLEQSAEPAESGGETKLPAGRIEIEQDLARLEARAKTKFGEPTRTLYVDYLVAEAAPLPPMPQAKKDSWSPLHKNPFVNTELLSDARDGTTAAEVKANQQLYKDKAERAGKILEKTRGEVIALLKSRRNKQNAKEIDAMIKRVETVRHWVGPLPAPHYCSGPNGFYRTNEHRIELCPEVLEWPEESLVRLLAHELGHAIDPCNASFALLKKKGAGGATGEAADGSVEPEVLRMAGYYSSGSPNGAYAHDKFGEASAGADDVAAIGYSKNPFRSVNECLASSASVNARFAEFDEVMKRLDQRIKQLRAQGLKDTDLTLARAINARKLTASQIKEHKACDFSSGRLFKSQIQEAFGDWVASKVLEKHVSEAPPEKKRDLVFESASSLLATGCKRDLLLRDRDSSVADFLVKAGCRMKDNRPKGELAEEAISQALDRIADSHPDSAGRVNKIIMANPAVAKAMGCSVKPGVKACD